MRHEREFQKVRLGSELGTLSRTIRVTLTTASSGRHILADMILSRYALIFTSITAMSTGVDKWSRSETQWLTMYLRLFSKIFYILHHLASEYDAVTSNQQHNYKGYDTGSLLSNPGRYFFVDVN